MATKLQFLSVGWVTPSGAPRAYFIRLTTPSGQPRDVPLTPIELARLAEQAVASLAVEVKRGATP